MKDQHSTLAHDPAAEMERERRRLDELNPPTWPRFDRRPEDPFTGWRR